MEFYQRKKEEVLQSFESTEQGLTQKQAEEHRLKYGVNALQGEASEPIWRIFLKQFLDFLVLILIAAAMVSGLLGDWESAAVIVTVIVLNAVLGTVQTVKAQTSLQSLKELSAPYAKVLRDHKVVQIPAADVVVGDVVMLEAGDSVCADGRILECAALKVSESALTGESLPVEKTSQVLEGQLPLGDRTNMVFSGSFATYGRGSFVVTAVGMQTEIGRIATLLKSTKEHKTPLQISLDRFGKRLSMIILLVCALVFVVQILVQQENMMQAFLFAVALAVAAIPEALSSIVTIVLSLGTQKMAKENAIIRKLQAVEGLGSVSVICSDKTGTLTQNKMTVKQCYITEILSANVPKDKAQEMDILLRAALLCNDALVQEEQEVGDPTETALVRWGQRHGLEALEVRRRYPRIAELPFDSERKLMSTLHEIDGESVLLTKGAVDVLLDRMILEEGQKTAIVEANEAFSRQGLRVLAFAEKRGVQRPLTLEDEQALTFVGLVAMMDPPRAESAQAVSDCIAAGMKPVMITGDHRVTAAAIAKEIGILKDEKEAVDGCVLDDMSDKALQELVPQISVYARVTPEHKLRIVQAWQERGCLVAMTGDGVNDAPALKQADIGVAMGITGTEVAKNAAGMVLTDDNFATIIKAVKNGRNVYANIKRAIQFLLSGNMAGILVVLYASLTALPLPFAAVHLLFINLLTDSLPAIALGLEPHSDEVMKQKPRSGKEGILTKGLLSEIAMEGLIIALCTIAGFHVGLSFGGQAVGSTMAFATLCLSRLLHGFNCKAKAPVLGSKRLWNNRTLLGAFGVGVLLLSAVLFVPGLSGLFQVSALSGILLMWVAGLSLASLLAIQGIKWIRCRLH